MCTTTNRYIFFLRERERQRDRERDRETERERERARARAPNCINKQEQAPPAHLALKRDVALREVCDDVVLYRYVLEEGVCSCTKKDVANGDVLRLYEAGEVFGERALLQVRETIHHFEYKHSSF